jgi:cob(I)alamin adenosyltransferase
VAVLGLARSLTNEPALAEEILALQRELFVVGADLAANPAQRAKLTEGVSAVTAAMTERLEARIDALVAERPLPEVFIVPGATPSSAALDMARSTIRRAERGVVALERDRPTNPEVRRYLNRLSDLLFVLARWEAGESEPASR